MSSLASSSSTDAAAHGCADSKKSWTLSPMMKSGGATSMGMTGPVGVDSQQQQQQRGSGKTMAAAMTAAATTATTTTAIATTITESPPAPSAEPATTIPTPESVSQPHPQPQPPTAAAATTATSTSNTLPPAPPPLQTTLPSPESERQVDEARAAIIASMSNMLDSELQTRATMLHEGATSLERQQREVARATDSLRREREKLEREAGAAARRVKELGNVQNWAEVLERGFLVLEETVRLANGGGGSDGSGSGSGSDDGSEGGCSCSECGRADGDVGGVVVADGDANGEVMMDLDGDVMDLDKDLDEPATTTDATDATATAPTAATTPDHHALLATDANGSRSVLSEASRSLAERDSSLGSGLARGSETASPSTESLRDVDGACSRGG